MDNLLNKKSLHQIISLIKNEYPKTALDISEAIGLISLELDGLYNNLSTEMNKQMQKEEVEKAMEKAKLAKTILAFREVADRYTELLSEFIEEDEEDINLEDSKKVINSKIILNYDDYKVDNRVAYDLFYNYTHKRPVAFSLAGKKYTANSMREILLKTCEILANIDYNLLESFIEDPAMKGRKISYFSKKLIEENGVARNAKINNRDIYVWINQSANSIRNLLRKMLKSYGYDFSDFKIFLRADYSKAYNK